MSQKNTSKNGQSLARCTSHHKVYLLSHFPLEVLDTLDDFPFDDENEDDRILDVLIEDHCWYLEIFNGDEGLCECPDAYLMRAESWRFDICSGSF